MIILTYLIVEYNCKFKIFLYILRQVSTKILMNKIRLTSKLKLTRHFVKKLNKCSDDQILFTIINFNFLSVIFNKF